MVVNGQVFEFLHRHVVTDEIERQIANHLNEDPEGVLLTFVP